MVASSPSKGVIPASATAGEFARVVGVTERVIAGRKADGRLPKLPNGSIDLHAVIRAGVAELARRSGKAPSADGMSPAEAYDTALRIGIRTAAFTAVAKVTGNAAFDDPDGIAGAVINGLCDMFEIPAMAPDPDKP